MSNASFLYGWGAKWDSNPRQPESQSGTLPTELFAPSEFFGPPGRNRTCDRRLRRPMLYPTELRAAVSGGRGEEIRTPDILLPKQARYQTALHPERVHYRHGTQVARERLHFETFCKHSGLAKRPPCGISSLRRRRSDTITRDSSHPSPKQKEPL